MEFKKKFIGIDLATRIENSALSISRHRQRPEQLRRQKAHKASRVGRMLHEASNETPFASLATLSSSPHSQLECQSSALPAT